MKRLELTKDLYTGIEEIDNQHRELIDRGNAVIFLKESKDTDKDVINALVFLLNYVDEHFSAEERLMEYYKYDRLDAHRQQHKRLSQDVKKLYRRAKANGTVKEVTNELAYMFSDWFIYHIKEWDGRFASFLKNVTSLSSVTIPGLDDMTSRHFDRNF